MSSRVRPVQSADRQPATDRNGTCPVVLAIDSSGPSISIALWQHRLLLDRTWPSAGNHTIELLPAIARMLGETGLTLHQIGIVAVNLGPGSFNGIRVGVSTAKGLALALDCAIVGCSALDMCAFESARGSSAIRPILRTGQDKVATALFSLASGTWVELEAPRLVDVMDIGSLTQGDWTICGDVDQDGTLRPTSEVGGSAPVTKEETGTAATLARLAAAWYRQGKVSDVSSLQPLYLRQPGVTIAKKPLQVV